MRVLSDKTYELYSEEENPRGCFRGLECLWLLCHNSKGHGDEFDSKVQIAVYVNGACTDIFETRHYSKAKFINPDAVSDHFINLNDMFMDEEEMDEVRYYEGGTYHPVSVQVRITCEE